MNQIEHEERKPHAFRKGIRAGSSRVKVRLHEELGTGAIHRAAMAVCVAMAIIMLKNIGAMP